MESLQTMKRYLLTILCAAAVAACVGLVGVLARVATGSPGSTATQGAAGSIYPVRPSKNGRYLVNKRGRPFLIVGDSPQALIVNLSLADAERFLANRRAAGFDTMWINLLCNTYTAGRPDATTYDGIAPFITPFDLSTPNETYFSRVDAVIRLAAKFGMLVFLDPIETGGWLDTLRKNGVEKDYAYGRYLGQRYRNFPNIVWFNGNDFREWRDPKADDVVLAVARGIRSVDRNHIHTVELEPVVSGSLDDERWKPYIKLDAAYTYLPTYAEVLNEYNRTNFLPTFMVEANYEFEHEYRSPETLRRQEYWSMLIGAAGQLYGNKYTWQFIDGWKTHLDTKGSAQFQIVTRLFRSVPWFRLVPDQGHLFVPGGVGTYSDSGSVNDNDYVTAARTRMASSGSPTCRLGGRSPSIFRGCPGRRVPGGSTPRAADSTTSDAERSRTPARGSSRLRVRTPTDTRTGCSS